MNHDEWLERADIYALGALDGEELTRFEAHLSAGCDACEHRLRETRETLTLLPRSLVALAPPPAAKTRLFQRIEREGPAVTPIPARPRPQWIWWGGWAGALAAAGLLVAVSWNLSTTRDEVRRLQERVAVLQTELSAREETLRLLSTARDELRRLQEQVVTLQTELSAREETVRFLSDPQVRYVSLAGLPASPGASGWLLWNPATRQGLFLTRGLPQAPPGRAERARNRLLATAARLFAE